MPEHGCAAVILAAGASTRLGRAKQLVPVSGEPLLSRTARLAREASCDPVIIVLGFEAEEMRAALADAPVQLVENEKWRSGMGSSLRCGVAALYGLDPCPSDAMMLVCDQIALTAEFLCELRHVHARGERPITASHYSGRAGVPAIFAAQYFPELLRAEGDRGARGILEQHPEDVTSVEFTAGVKDLDTPEQLRELL